MSFFNGRTYRSLRCAHVLKEYAKKEYSEQHSPNTLVYGTLAKDILLGPSVLWNALSTLCLAPWV